MEKEAIIFIDYNETFDDITNGKGNVFICALRRFIKHFDGNVRIVVITSAICKNKDLSIKDDLAFTINHLPKLIREKFCFLIEENCRYISTINTNQSEITFSEREILSISNGTKKDGVELTLKHIDPNNQSNLCVFAGNSEIADLVMMDANVGGRDKYFLLANRRVLKSATHPVYKLSMRPEKRLYDFSAEITQQLGQSKNIIIKTSCNSYGVGRGLETVTNLIKHNEDLSK